GGGRGGETLQRPPPGGSPGRDAGPASPDLLSQRASGERRPLRQRDSQPLSPDRYQEHRPHVSVYQKPERPSRPLPGAPRWRGEASSNGSRLQSPPRAFRVSQKNADSEISRESSIFPFPSA